MIMNFKIIIIFSFITSSTWIGCLAQDQLNVTDAKGLKQGHWIKKYPNESIMYEGFFKDNHPVGEFKRYYDDLTLLSVLIYSNDGKQADATLYHPNGNIASKGKYVNQLKEGKWQFYSGIYKGYLICEEIYSANLKNGLSVYFNPDSTITEKVTFVKGKKHGDWVQYYPDGKISLKSTFLNGKLNGKFEVWYENGAIEFSGQYKNDARDGKWLIFNRDGSVKYKIEYKDGITNDREMDIYESDYLDSLEKNKGKISDPEKSGVIR
jgi:antitoxin component YwqK of YwqJK toxin-antitoxin module